MGFWNQFKMLRDLIFMSIVYFSMIFFFFNSVDFKLKVYLIIPYFLMFFFPVIFLHFNYLNKNKNVVFEISENVIVKKNRGCVLKYSVNDIDSIIIYTGGTRNTVSPSLAHSNYYYAKIKLLNKSSFIITSLYSSKIDKILEENFKDVKITTEKVFYPMI